MFSLDPAKLLLIGVVALVVLGPDKLPAATRKISSLLHDLQRMRASLETEVRNTTCDLPFTGEVRKARDAVGQFSHVSDPRQALYRAAGLSSVTSADGEKANVSSDYPPAVPGSVDVSELASTRSVGDNPSSERAAPSSVGGLAVGAAHHGSLLDDDPSQN
jgi:Sec-independent protein translocase protein TatA